MLVVRSPGRTGRRVLYVGVQELEDRQHHAVWKGRLRDPQEAGGQCHGGRIKLDGQRFTALNGGPLFTFTEAISFQINCETQEEIDYYWGKLTAGGDPKSQQCGWLKDQYGLSWQVVVPAMMARMMADPESAKSQRAMEVVMKMKKPVIADLERAYAG